MTEERKAMFIARLATQLVAAKIAARDLGPDDYEIDEAVGMAEKIINKSQPTGGHCYHCNGAGYI